MNCGTIVELLKYLQVNKIGETEIGIINLKSRKEDLIATLRKLDEKQSELAKKLEDKYGKGSISLDTNEFTPTQE